MFGFEMCDLSPDLRQKMVDWVRAKAVVDREEQLHVGGADGVIAFISQE